jgi:hypothetical protein
MTADPLCDARAEGLRVEICVLGDWSPHALLAEYDRAARVIRVSAKALARALQHGNDAGVAFFAAAVAHELYHHAVAERRVAAAPDKRACEREADAFVLRMYGIDGPRAAAAVR